MRLRLIAAVAALLAACMSAAACTSHSGTTAPSSPPSSASPQDAHTLTVDGRERHYLLHAPAQPAAGKLPLVIMLHGGGGSAAGAERSYGWDALADREHFAVAYPDGLQRSWVVGGGCCGPPAQQGVDDVAFVSAVVRDVARRLPIDADRVYATGISEGGMMSYRLACDSTLFAAVGPDSATLLGSCPRPAPLSVIHIHGTADERIRYDGAAGAGVNHIDGPAVPDLAAQWRAVDRCPPATTRRSGTVTTSTSDCPQGRAVELVTIAGAGHQWPGKACVGGCARGRADEPSTALDATATIWRFFATHVR